MAKSYQLVAWTDKGQARMLPSEVTEYIHSELDVIDRLSDRIRYETDYEVGDILRVSRAYEKLGAGLLGLGRIEDAFLQFSQAALVCKSCSSGQWIYYEEYETISPPLRGRFFAMYGKCKDLVREYPGLRLEWEKSGIAGALDCITDSLWREERNAEFRAVCEYEKARNFTRNANRLRYCICRSRTVMPGKRSGSSDKSVSEK